MVHHDLKPHNVMLTDKGVAKIIDFGLARVRQNTIASSTKISGAGTLQYMAPEKLQGQAGGGRKADVYAYGMVVYELWTGEVPFAGLDQFQLQKRVLAQQLPTMGESVPAHAAMLVRACWRRDPDQRPEAAMVAPLLASMAAVGGGARALAPLAAQLSYALERGAEVYAPVGGEPAALQQCGYVGPRGACTLQARGPFCDRHQCPRDGCGNSKSSGSAACGQASCGMAAGDDIYAAVGPGSGAAAEDVGVRKALAAWSAGHHKEALSLVGAGLEKHAEDVLLLLMRRYILLERPALGPVGVDQEEDGLLRKRAKAAGQAAGKAAVECARRLAFEGSEPGVKARASFLQGAVLGIVLDNAVEAAPLYRKAAEQGYAGGQCGVGWCYDNGNGVQQDKAEAAKWYRKAAEQGYACGQNNLGVCYKHGDGVQQDMAEAVKWYRKAAEQGYAAAQHNLGNSYFDGDGVRQDKAEAAKWYRKAAEQGNAAAQFNLGVCYERGDGVRQDKTEAAKWYRKAAEQGFATAQFNLGNSYANGDGVQQDKAEAVKWYRKAAEQGHAGGQNGLGVCYANGDGVRQDKAEAAKWCRKAAEQGQPNAIENLKLL